MAHESVKEVAACLWKRPCKTNSLLAGSIIFLVDACLCNNFEQWETLGDKRLKRKYKSTFKWINLCSKWFKHKLVWNCIEGPKIFFCLHKHFLGVYSSHWRLWNCWIDVSTTFKSMLVQASIPQFYKHWFNGCTSIDLTVVQALIRQFYKDGLNSFTSIDHCASIESTVTIVKSMVILIIFKKMLHKNVMLMFWWNTYHQMKLQRMRKCKMIDGKILKVSWKLRKSIQYLLCIKEWWWLLIYCLVLFSNTLWIVWECTTILKQLK